jgi:hypothetical protein
MAALRRFARRLAGRDGLEMPDRLSTTQELEVGRKALEAQETVLDARRAMDAFTRSVDDAMRGTHGRRPAGRPHLRPLPGNRN